MADFPIQVRVSEYDTEHGHRVHAKRGYVLCEFTALPILCDAFVDTAAPSALFLTQFRATFRGINWQKP